MFKIPAWEDDNPKTNTTFVQSVKKKEKRENKTKSPKHNIDKEKNNNENGLNTLNHVPQKRKLENKVMKSKKDTVSNTKKKKTDETYAIPETQSFDEILLNAKKKKFNEVIENDDKEDLLFSENKQKKGKKTNTEMSSNTLLVNNKPTKDKRKQNKKTNSGVNEKSNNTNSKVSGESNKGNSKVTGESNKANSKVTGESNKANSEVTGESNKANSKVTGESNKGNSKVTGESNKANSKVTGESNKANSKVTGESNKANSDVNESFKPFSNKKARLRSLIDSSHRSPINISRSGNKLRDRMLERLKAAQFRYLNEKLYTSSGSEAQQLFQSDPTAFETYHQGYQLQVKKWPVNPLDVIVQKIMKMPKTHTIADMGCGSAELSRRVPHETRSLDLVATQPGVLACDMARTPLLSASVDVAVYCLALMGTDLTQYLLEANRIMKTGGHLLIAEVESRFNKVEDFAKEVERLGFKLKQLDKSNKVFYFMEFTKVKDPPVKKAKLPVLTLKPCLYKRR